MTIKDCFKFLFWCTAVIGIVDMVFQLITQGEFKLIQTLLHNIIGG